MLQKGELMLYWTVDENGHMYHFKRKSALRIFDKWNLYSTRAQRRSLKALYEEIERQDADGKKRT